MCFVCARYCHICWQLHLILWSQSQKALEFSLVYHCGFSVLCFKTDCFLSPLKLKFNYYFICFPILWHPSWFVIQIFDLFLCVSPASCLLYTSHMVHWILPLHDCETMHAGSCGEPIPEPGFCLGVCVCVCALASREEVISLGYIKEVRQNLNSTLPDLHPHSPTSSFLHSSSAAMHLLLTLLGAVLSSLMVSSEVQPQADFNVQAVRQMATLVCFILQYLFLWSLYLFNSLYRL